MPASTSVPAYQVPTRIIASLPCANWLAMALLPAVPTVSESGLKGYESGNWFGIFAPAGTPRPVVERLNAAINRAMTSGEMKDRLLSQGAEPLTGSPEDLGRHVQREIAKYAKIVKQAGIKTE